MDNDSEEQGEKFYNDIYAKGLNFGGLSARLKMACSPQRSMDESGMKGLRKSAVWPCGHHPKEQICTFLR